MLTKFRPPMRRAYFGSNFTLMELSIAVSARRIAAIRLGAVPILVRCSSRRTVHFHPVGLDVWTTLYWMPLCSMGTSKHTPRLLTIVDSGQFPD